MPWMRNEASFWNDDRGSGSKWKSQRCSRYSSRVQESTPAAAQPAMAAAPMYAEARYTRYDVNGPQMATTCHGRTREKYFSIHGTVNISGLPWRGRSSLGCGAR